MKYGLGLFIALAAPMAFAGSEAATPVIGYDNVHIRVSDPVAAVQWYVKHLGATTPAAGQLYFGKSLIAVVKTTNPQPSTGSVIDHIGMSFANVDEKANELQLAGAKMVLSPRDSPGVFRYAYIEDPWGVKIELVQDPETPGFHHVHLRVKDPEATLRWYEQMFGGQRA